MKKKVLIIDNHLTNTSDFVSVLGKEYDVDVTVCTSTASAKLKKSYNFVIIDVIVPTGGEDESGDGLTGFIYYETELKKKEIPVLFWSWNVEFENAVKDKNWDKTGFLLKETDDDHLLKGVERFCKKYNI